MQIIIPAEHIERARAGLVAIQKEYWARLEALRKQPR